MEYLSLASGNVSLMTLLPYRPSFSLPSAPPKPSFMLENLLTLSLCLFPIKTNRSLRISDFFWIACNWFLIQVFVLEFYSGLKASLCMADFL